MLGFASASSDADEQYRQWVANGFPTSPEEAVGPQPKDEDNAVVAMQTAFDEFAKLRKADGFRLAVINLKEDDQSSSDIDRLNQEIETALLRPEFSIPIDWGEYFYSVSDVEDDMRDVIELFLREAERLSLSGDYQGSIKYLNTCWKINERMSRRNPFLASSIIFTRSNIWDIGVRILSRSKNDKFIRLKLKEMVDEDDWIPDSDKVSKSVFYMTYSYLLNVDLGSTQEILEDMGGHYPYFENPKQIGGKPQTLFARPVAGEYLRLVNEYWAYRQRHNDPALRETESERLVSLYTSSRSIPSKVAAKSTQFSDAHLAWVTKKLKSDRNAMKAYLKVMEYYSIHNTWPSDLTQAGVPESDLREEFSGKSLGYSSNPESMRVWHADYDKVDNGGLACFENINAKRGNRNSDFVLAYPGVWNSYQWHE